jgi:two-component system OmpR family response regulator
MTENIILQAGDSGSASFQRQTNPRQRILVADDDIIFRQLNTKALIRSGYKVDAAADGAAAWEALNANSYDLLVTDNDMPNVSGVELLKKLHATHMALPVIMVSGTMPTEELKRQPWLQIEAALLKPVTPGELLATVRNVLYAGDSASGQIAPANRQNQSPAIGLRR